MKLTKFKVQNFRSFVDSGWIKCDDVIAIAGVNEAGKSNLLRALWKLKPVFKADNKISQNDVPIDNFDNIMDAENLPIFITAEFELQPQDKEIIAQKFPNIKVFDTLTISRYLSGNYSVTYPIAIEDKIKQRLDTLVIKIMPGFIYYSNYGNLDSNIYLPQMLEKFNKSGINTLSKSKRRTVKLLLHYIGITPEMLAKDIVILEEANKNQQKLTADQLYNLVTTKEKYKKLLKEASSRLTQEFNQWWRQGNYKFEFAFNGSSLTIFVTDSSGIRAPLEERSVGMQWFLSFFLVFSIESKLYYTNTIILLDESGATLHGIAQQDLVVFFDELAKTNQIIYSTHSSFMLPPDKLYRTKVVYKDKAGHSKVSENLSSDINASKDGIIPISTSINLQVTESILKDTTPILVVEESDEIYLNMIKNHLLASNTLTSQIIDKNLIVIKTAKNSLIGTAQILSKNGVLPYILLDKSREGKTLNTLQSTIYKNQTSRLISPSMLGGYQTLEDIIPYEYFAEACGNYLVDILGEEFEVRVSKPFILQLEEANLSQKLPSDYRAQMAKLINDYLNANKKKLKNYKNALKLWEDMFLKIIKN